MPHPRLHVDDLHGHHLGSEAKQTCLAAEQVCTAVHVAQQWLQQAAEDRSQLCKPEGAGPVAELRAVPRQVGLTHEPENQCITHMAQGQQCCLELLAEH